MAFNSDSVSCAILASCSGVKGSSGTGTSSCNITAELTRPRGSVKFALTEHPEKHAIDARVHSDCWWRLAIVDEIVNEHSPQKNVSGEVQNSGHYNVRG